jgi:hypothetical protein
MAISFMLNPAKRGHAKWARCLKAAHGDPKKAAKLMASGRKPRAAASRRKVHRKIHRKGHSKWARCLRAAGGDPKIAKNLMKRGCRISKAARKALRQIPRGKMRYLRARAARIRAERRGAIQTNPKRRKRGMAAKTKRRRRGWTKAKRIRAGKKAWRTRLRNAGRPSGRRRRHGSRHRRRHNSMYSGRLYANPAASISAVVNTVTDTRMLTQFAVGAAGASVSEMLGSFIASKIAEFAPTTFGVGGTLSQLLGAASRIGSGVAVAMLLPPKYKTAWIMGSGAVAVQPLVSGLLKPILDPIGSALGMKSQSGLRGGIGGWISAAEVYGRSRRGVGAWLTARQLPGVGVAGLGYSVPNYAFQPGMQSAFTM